MKKLIKSSLFLTLFDIRQSIKHGWVVSTHERKLCLENEKVIFVPYSMPKI